MLYDNSVLNDPERPLRDVLNFGRPTVTVRALSRNFCARSMSANAWADKFPDFRRPRESDGIIPSNPSCGITSSFLPKRVCAQRLQKQDV